MHKKAGILLGLVAVALFCIFAAVVTRPAAPASEPAPTASPQPTAAPTAQPTPVPTPSPPAYVPPATGGLSLAGVPFDVLALDTQRLGWGQGKQVNEQNQPIGAVSYAGTYSQYGGLFLAPKQQTPTIYLTFDFGYETGYSASILDTLAEKQVPATFFLVSSYAKNQTDTVQRMLNDGHSVGSHSVHHKDMTGLSLEEARSEIVDFNDTFSSLYGKTPTLFRFPEGVFSQQLLALAANEGMYSVFWSWAYQDWDNANQPDEAESLEKMLNAAHPDAIYLLHPMATNASVLADLIDGLRQKGYTLAAL